MIVYTTSGLLRNRRIPGCRPWIISAPRITAAEMPPGMPSTNIGISEVPVTPLLEPSVAARPLISPSPNRSPGLPWRISQEYAIHCATLAPAAGTMPMIRPVSQPRTSDQRTCTISDHLGQMFHDSRLTPAMFPVTRPSQSSMPWANANSPTIAGRMLMPDSKPT
jgi:hypothetical protein